MGSIYETYGSWQRVYFTEAATRGVLSKKAFLKNFAIFTGKNFCWSLFLKMLQAFRPVTLLKWDTNAGVFPWIFWNF